MMLGIGYHLTSWLKPLVTSQWSLLFQQFSSSWHIGWHVSNPLLWTFSALYLLLSAQPWLIKPQSIRLAIGAMLMKQKVASTITATIVLEYLLQRLPVFTSWFEYASLTYYSYRLLLPSQYKANDTCVNLCLLLVWWEIFLESITRDLATRLYVLLHWQWCYWGLDSLLMMPSWG